MSTRRLFHTTRPSWRHVALLVMLGVVLLGLYTWAFHDVFAARVLTVIDFYPSYLGAKLYIAEGLNPYSAAVTEQIQTDIYAGAPPNGEPHHAFFYPLYTLILTVPYLLLPTYAWVQAALQVTLQVLLVVSVLLILDFFGWRPRPWQVALLVLWSLLLFPAAYSIILGQLSIPVFFLTVLAIWLLFRGEPSARRDVLAGACLALSTIKPQMQFLIIPLLVL